ncbi:hypothetical protein TrCOL_g2704 [Triparma columacea]|uniref:Alpha-glucosidase n=1 Tax=Triparma columacea TaxID=722753 RepID=A0A9W7GJA8_9STRA|nr:hypothetical protein TrCOL_g2704 [Triparma columacea]
MVPRVLNAVILLLITSLVSGDTYKLQDGVISVKLNSETTSPSVLISATTSTGDEVPLLSSVTSSSGETLPLFATATSKVLKGPVDDTFYVLEERTKWHSRTDSMSIDSVDESNLPESLAFSGEMFRDGSREDTKVPYTMTIKGVQGNQFGKGASVDFKLEVEDGHANRVYITAASPSDEKIFGHGIQYSSVNHKNKRVPIFIAEGGIGRGLQPITGFLNAFAGGAGGDEFTSYGCKPQFVTDTRRGGLLFNTEGSVWDWGAEGGEAVEVEVFGYPVEGRLFMWEDSPAEYVEMITEYTGRMSPLPEWTQEGAIIGLEGGSEVVESSMDKLIEAEVQMVGLWLQDWSGLHHAYDGDRLLWDWKLSEEQYPDWSGLRTRMNSLGINMLTYINPYFASNLDNGEDNSQFAEGDANGYFIKNSNNETYVMKSGSIRFGCLDVTNPNAVEWMKDIIKERMLDEAGSMGWMSDFGEAVPYDGVMYSGVSGADHHNEYPEMWQALNYDAVREAGMEDDVAFFSRSAWNKSPGNARVFWLGDQLVTFDDKDGLQTTVIAQQSGGLSGHSIAHSDIGGYTVADYPLAHYHRSPELLKRWSECEAFSGSMFRTHVGSSFEDEDSQAWHDDVVDHFGVFSKVFGYLKEYRLELMQVAEERGLPLVRSMFYQFPDDPAVWDEDLMKEQFMFGDDFLVAPVFQEGAVEKNVYFPVGGGQWIGLWDGSVWNETVDYAGVATVAAPIGRPPVFYKEGSKWGSNMRKWVIDQGFGV